MKRWFLSLQSRERLLVAAAAIVAGGGLFFLAVWEPLNQSVTELRDRADSQRELAMWLGEVKQRANELRQRGGGDPVKARDRSLLSVVDETSRNAGLGNAVTRIQPEGDNRAAVTLEDAAFNQLVFWLHELETQYGIRATALSVNRDEEAAGVVQARMTLERTS